ncbi:sigma-70 family RNA polymerase sigma factor [Patescibacteria group bacterium]|nr:MAG: sigma-70 family RNA polymerase sigma factor [Patescibacteria group bacterium]
METALQKSVDQLLKLAAEKNAVLDLSDVRAALPQALRAKPDALDAVLAALADEDITVVDDAETKELVREVEAMAFAPAVRKLYGDQPLAGDLRDYFVRLAMSCTPLPREQVNNLVRVVQANSRQILTPDPERPHLRQLRFRRGAAAVRAQEMLWRHDLRYILAIVRRRQHLGRLEFADAVQEATLGYLHAVDKFQPEFGNTLLTYASWWIKQSIHRAEIQSAMNRLPVHVHEMLNRVLRRMAREGTTQEDAIRAEAGSSEQRNAYLNSAYMVKQGFLSLDQPVGNEGEERTVAFSDLLVESTQKDQAADAREISREELGRVAVLLNVLPPRECQVFVKRRIMERTLTDAGRPLEVCRERARQIEVIAARRLAALLKSKDVATALVSVPFLSLEEFHTLCRPPGANESPRLRELRQTVGTLAERVRRLPLLAIKRPGRSRARKTNGNGAPAAGPEPRPEEQAAGHDPTPGGDASEA